VQAEATARLTELLREVDRHRDAIREFGLAGYVTMVEKHRKDLGAVLTEIRAHCREHSLPLPEGVPTE
jgi:hypothetical protein